MIFTIVAGSLFAGWFTLHNRGFFEKQATVVDALFIAVAMGAAIIWVAFSFGTSQTDHAKIGGQAEHCISNRGDNCP